MHHKQHSNSKIFYEVHHSTFNQLKYRQYTQIKELGHGGFATCYEVIRSSDNKRFAIKVMTIGDPNDKSKSTKDHKRSKKGFVTIEKAKQQAKTLAKLDHSNIVKYESDFMENDTFNLVMQLCQFGSLCDLLKKRFSLTQLEVRYYLVQMVNALIYLKSMNIIHRDLKPSNFLLDKNLKLKICDFGLATFADYQFHKQQTTCGTINYISPEMITKSPYSFEVDVWSVGVILQKIEQYYLRYTMLYGIPPFQTKQKVTKDIYDRIKRCDYNLNSPAISQQAKDMIRKILVANPKDRLKLQDILLHPFISSSSIPYRLPAQYIKLQPNIEFLKTYQRPRSRNLNYLVKQSKQYKQSQIVKNFVREEKNVNNIKSIMKDLNQGKEERQKKNQSQDKRQKKSAMKICSESILNNHNYHKVYDKKLQNNVFYDKRSTKDINQIATSSPQSIQRVNSRVNSPQNLKQTKIQFARIQSNANAKQNKIFEQKMVLESPQLPNQKSKELKQNLINKINDMKIWEHYRDMKKELSYDFDQYEKCSLDSWEVINKIKKIDPKILQKTTVNPTKPVQPTLIYIQSFLKPTFSLSSLLIAYMLSSGYIGLLFEDFTTLLIDPKRQFIYFIKETYKLKGQRECEMNLQGKDGGDIFRIEFEQVMQEENQKDRGKYENISKQKQKNFKKQRKRYLNCGQVQKLQWVKKVIRQFQGYDIKFNKQIKKSNDQMMDEQIDDISNYVRCYKQINHHFYFELNNGNVCNVNFNYKSSTKKKEKQNLKFEDVQKKRKVGNFEIWTKDMMKNILTMTQLIHVPQSYQLFYFEHKLRAQNKKQSDSLLLTHSISDEEFQEKRILFNKSPTLPFKMQPLMVLDLPLSSIPAYKIVLSTINSLKNQLKPSSSQLSRLSSRQLNFFRQDLKWLSIIKTLKNPFFVFRLQKQFQINETQMIKKQEESDEMRNEHDYDYDEKKQLESGQVLSSSSLHSSSAKFSNMKNNNKKRRFYDFLQMQAKERFIDVLGVDYFD